MSVMKQSALTTIFKLPKYFKAQVVNQVRFQSYFFKDFKPPTQDELYEFGCVLGYEHDEEQSIKVAINILLAFYNKVYKHLADDDRVKFSAWFEHEHGGTMIIGALINLISRLGFIMMPDGTHRAFKDLDTLVIEASGLYDFLGDKVYDRPVPIMGVRTLHFLFGHRASARYCAMEDFIHEMKKYICRAIVVENKSDIEVHNEVMKMRQSINFNAPPDPDPTVKD